MSKQIHNTTLILAPYFSIFILYANYNLNQKNIYNLNINTYQIYLQNTFTFIICGIMIAIWILFIIEKDKKAKSILSIINALVFLLFWFFTYIPSLNSQLYTFILKNYIFLAIWIGIFLSISIYGILFDK